MGSLGNPQVSTTPLCAHARRTPRKPRATTASSARAPPTPTPRGTHAPRPHSHTRHKPQRNLHPLAPSSRASLEVHVQRTTHDTDAPQEEAALKTHAAAHSNVPSTAARGAQRRATIPTAPAPAPAAAFTAKQGAAAGRQGRGVHPPRLAHTGQAPAAARAARTRCFAHSTRGRRWGKSVRERFPTEVWRLPAVDAAGILEDQSLANGWMQQQRSAGAEQRAQGTREQRDGHQPPAPPPRLRLSLLPPTTRFGGRESKRRAHVTSGAPDSARAWQGEAPAPENTCEEEAAPHHDAVATGGAHGAWCSHERGERALARPKQVAGGAMAAWWLTPCRARPHSATHGRSAPSSWRTSHPAQGNARVAAARAPHTPTGGRVWTPPGTPATHPGSRWLRSTAACRPYPPQARGPKHAGASPQAKGASKETTGGRADAHGVRVRRREDSWRPRGGLSREARPCGCGARTSLLQAPAPPPPPRRGPRRGLRAPRRPLGVPAAAGPGAARPPAWRAPAVLAGGPRAPRRPARAVTRAAAAQSPRAAAAAVR